MLLPPGAGGNVGIPDGIGSNVGMPLGTGCSVGRPDGIGSNVGGMPLGLGVQRWSGSSVESARKLCDDLSQCSSKQIKTTQSMEFDKYTSYVLRLLYK